MCGIVGYTGKKQAAPVLLDGLSKLEYRGYDSAGLAVRDGEKLAETLRQQQIPAQVIGKITKGNERLLLNEDEVRYLDKPAMDEIFRIGKE